MNEATLPEISIDLQYLKQYYKIKYYCFGTFDGYGDLYFQKCKTFNAVTQYTMAVADYEFTDYEPPIITLSIIIISCFECNHWIGYVD